MPKNRRFFLASRPKGLVTSDNLRFTTEEAPSPHTGEVLVQTRYLSVDPTNRIWMNDHDQYMPPIAIGEIVRALGVGTVVESKLPDFKPGDTVAGLLGWQDYSIHSHGALTKVPNLDVPMTNHLSVLGMTGMTAYFGLLDVTSPRPGETLVVSGAAGAVGSIVGQIGKIAGLRVVGIAGGPDKCRWLTHELGFDAAIDYKRDQVGEALQQHCPNGIDVYFDNVGGKVSDAVFPRMNLFGRVSLCGLISGYNTGDTSGPKSYASILMKRLTVRGFIVMDFIPRYPQALQALYGWVKAGRIKFAEDVEQGLERAPVVLNKLFEGTNTGKLILGVNP